MDVVAYFLMWAVIGYFLMRVGCGAHASGHGHNHGGAKRDHAAHGANGQPSDLKWIAPAQDIDPVCGKTVSTDKAKSSVHDGIVYYFCSRECREMFEAAPDQYVGAQAEHPTQPMELSHV
ncbi:MAG: YHS domain-containing protein [Alphaproteobacteria bacterium]|nr:YHS domain-containing protein [Alphaproteobacteria bacterium]